jgi:hypothetical protein
LRVTFPKQPGRMTPPEYKTFTWDMRYLLVFV